MAWVGIPVALVSILLAVMVVQVVRGQLKDYEDGGRHQGEYLYWDFRL